MKTLINFKFTLIKQKIDAAEILHDKIVQLAKLLRTKKHPIVLTGAGISTSCGIPDYRSSSQTLSPTGPGLWNLPKQQRPNLDPIVNQAIPSFTHMAIEKLMSQGIVKYVVSGNTDGLHLKSGINRSKIAELHGNRNMEKCVKCKKVYYRAYRVINRLNKQEQNEQSHTEKHATNRFCQCGGPLIDSIVYFGQKLDAYVISKALRHADESDMILCIGSSLSVKPSVNIPMKVLSKGGDMAIINLQETPFDNSVLKISNFSDTAMKHLMKQLKISIEPFNQHYYLRLEIIKSVLIIGGKNKEGESYSVIENVRYGETGGYKRAGQEEWQIRVENIGSEIEVDFYCGGKVLIVVNEIYKIFHGQVVDLKIIKNGQNFIFEQF